MYKLQVHRKGKKPEDWHTLATSANCGSLAERARHHAIFFQRNRRFGCDASRVMKGDQEVCNFSVRQELTPPRVKKSAIRVAG